MHCIEMKHARTSPSRCNRYWLFVGVVVVLFLAAYAVAEALQVPRLTDAFALSGATFTTALLGVGLLTVDVLLPVPSSLVMTALGAAFGLLVGGLFSFVGSALGFVLAFWLESRGSPLVRRLLSRQEINRADRALQKWGVLALVLTRPLPILAETTAIMAGVSRLPLAKALLAAAAGSLPACLAYAWAGSRVRDFGATAIIFLALICLALVAWALEKRKPT
jgi:uncharacterized membrane protein YdjX (TVP38/TMEM64 family)